MTVDIDVRLDIKELRQAFHDVSGHLEDLTQEAMLQAGNMVAARAKEAHDYEDQTGYLTNSIMASPPTGSVLKGDLESIVAAGAPYAGHIEYGTDDHFVSPKHRKALRWGVEGGYRFSRGHEVSGINAREFLANALKHELDGIEAEVEAAAELAFHRAGL